MILGILWLACHNSEINQKIGSNDNKVPRRVQKTVETKVEEVRVAETEERRGKERKRKEVRREKAREKIKEEKTKKSERIMKVKKIAKEWEI